MPVKNITDASGWPSEPDVKDRRKIIRSKKLREDKAKDKQKLSREPPEVEDDLTLPESEREDNEQSLNGNDNEGLNLVQRTMLIRRQLAVRDAHEALEEALDAAIAAEKELGKQLYAIENVKKNTLTAANCVYGDGADFKNIIESANGAKIKAVEKPNLLVKEASDMVSKLESLTSQAMVGRGLISLADSTQSFDFSVDECSKIDELRSLIEQNKQADAEFTAKTPRGVDIHEYREQMNVNGVPLEMEESIDEPSL